MHLSAAEGFPSAGQPDQPLNTDTCALQPCSKGARSCPRHWSRPHETQSSRRNLAKRFSQQSEADSPHSNATLAFPPRARVKVEPPPSGFPPHLSYFEPQGLARFGPLLVVGALPLRSFQRFPGEAEESCSLQKPALPTRFLSTAPQAAAAASGGGVVGRTEGTEQGPGLPAQPRGRRGPLARSLHIRSH